MPSDINVVFYNVAELAAEARWHKQLENEAMLISNNAHTAAELSAAASLIMLRYPMHPTVVKQITPTDQIIVEPQQPAEVVCSPKKRCMSNKDTITETKKQQLSFKPINTKFKSNVNSPTSKSSLLMSCRNILKEFLSQNSRS